MKKIFLSLIAIVSIQLAASAQVVINSGGNVVLNGFPKDGNVHDLKDSITNNTGAAALITWSMTSSNILSGWTVAGICDPVGCHVFNGDSHSFTLNPGQTEKVYVQMMAGAGAADGTSTVVLTSNFGTMTYTFTSWPTNVKDFENNNIVTMYPNPASSNVNMNINDKRVKNVTINSVVGKRIAAYSIDNSSSINIPLSGYADGVYMVQFTDKNGKLLGVKRLTKK